jgi:hypothetical protein
MAWIRRINQLSSQEKQGLYRILIAPELFGRFKINPVTFRGLAGIKSLRFYCPPNDPIALIEVRQAPSASEPIYSIQISDSQDVKALEWDFLLINDPDSPRFDIDVDEHGRDTLFGRASRNLPEERRAMEAGLCPGQVRSGLRLTGSAVRCIEHFAKTLSIQTVFLDALFYHNAIGYERLGFFYFEGFRRMKRIHEAFQEGGELYRRLDAASPFRKPGFHETIRGRSWAIHDGILDGLDDELLADGWISPRMYFMPGRQGSECTFPGGRF